MAGPITATAASGPSDDGRLTDSDMGVLCPDLCGPQVRPESRARPVPLRGLWVWMVTHADDVGHASSLEPLPYSTLRGRARRVMSENHSSLAAASETVG